MNDFAIRFKDELTNADTMFCAMLSAFIAAACLVVEPDAAIALFFVRVTVALLFVYSVLNAADIF